MEITDELKKEIMSMDVVEKRELLEEHGVWQPDMSEHAMEETIREEMEIGYISPNDIPW